jgi:amidase
MIDGDEIIYASVTSLARAIRTKRVASSEVVDAYLARIEAVNPQLNAVVQLTAERAREQAQEADAALARGEVKGPLHGVPVTIKDSFETAGVISTAGTKGRAAFIPEKDATVVARLRAAGAILLGKTNTPEVTLSGETDNYVYGRTNNPYDFSLTPGGSSGGAAAIISAGGSPLDLGTDTGGSIRMPAHFCGITGIKPTSGRVPRTGHIISFDMGALDKLTQVGPLARYVQDLALVLPIIAGVDWVDPAIVPMPLAEPDSVTLKGLRVALYTDNGLVSPTAATAGVVRTAAAVLADEGLLVMEDRPPLIDEAAGMWQRFFTADGGAGVKRLLRQAGTVEMHPLIQWTQAESAMATADFSSLLARWEMLRSAMLSFLEKYDVIVCPVCAHPAAPHGTFERITSSYVKPYNLTGWPAGSVPGGISPQGLPIGVQVVGRPWREDVVLAVMQCLETALGGWQRPPL